MSGKRVNELVYSDDKGNLDIKIDKYGCRQVVLQTAFVASYRQFGLSECALQYDLTKRTTKEVLIKLGVYRTRHTRELGDEWKPNSREYWLTLTWITEARKYGLTPINPRQDGMCTVLLHEYVRCKYENHKKLPNEVVHHIDNNKDNNRVENLEIKDRGDHTSGHVSNAEEDLKRNLVEQHGYIEEPTTGDLIAPPRSSQLYSLSDIPASPL